LAAKIALDEPFNLKRVCIFDWDIHHGDGTQSMFYNDNRLLYVSLHRSDKLTFYPQKEIQQSQFIGEGEGKGFNVNVAWETGLVVDEFDRMSNKVSELGNVEYRYACDTLLFPIIEEYQPELIIVSCGFDSAIHDFLGWSNLTPMMYEYMTRRLGDICPKLLVVQEGGYNIDYLGQHASGVVNGLFSGAETLKPTPADLDGGLNKSLIEEVDISGVKDWAKGNVETTRAHLAGCWKATPSQA